MGKGGLKLSYHSTASVYYYRSVLWRQAPLPASNGDAGTAIRPVNYLTFSTPVLLRWPSLLLVLSAVAQQNLSCVRRVAVDRFSFSSVVGFFFSCSALRVNVICD